MCVLLYVLRLQDKDIELCAANIKVQQLEVELQDLSSQESKDEASLAKVKKQLRDLEAKVKDQEEELDEQAGTIQMLEQVEGDAVWWNTWVCIAKGCLYHTIQRFKFIPFTSLILFVPTTQQKYWLQKYQHVCLRNH